MSARPRVLDVGCGRNKQPGAIGIDIIPGTAADVLCDLDRIPYPFRDGSFDALHAVHVIEHVGDVVRTIEEFHRLVRPGGRIRIVTPHFTDSSSYCDPTHRWHLTSFSMRTFTGPATFDYYSGVRLREVSTRVRMLSLWRWLGWEWLVNRSRRIRRFWENYLCFLVRGKVIEWEFEVPPPGPPQTAASRARGTA